DLPLDDLKTDFHKHWHHEYDGRDYLISYIKRAEKGRVYYVALKISLEYLVRSLFPDELDDLRGKMLYCIRNDHGRVVYGEPVGPPGKFLYEKAFPTTLYLWRLQMAPPRASALATEERERRRNEYALITLALGILVASVASLFYTMDKERRASELKSD